MKLQMTTVLFAALLTADNFSRAAEPLNNGDGNDDMIDIDEDCIDLTYFTPQGCCDLYTEAYFQGEKFEICNQDKLEALPTELVIKGTKSWVCGPHTQAGFSEGLGLGSFIGSQNWVSSGKDYVYNMDVSTSKSPLNENFSTGPFTKAYVMDYSAWHPIMLSTTMFDAPECTGRSASLAYFLHDFLISPTWQENLEMYGIDSENTVFRSIIIEPFTELILYYEDGVNYESIANFEYFPLCAELPQGNFFYYNYMGLPSIDGED